MKRFLSLALLAVALLSLVPPEVEATRRGGGPRRGGPRGVRRGGGVAFVQPRRVRVGFARPRFATVVDPVTGLLVRVRVR